MTFSQEVFIHLKYIGQVANIGQIGIQIVSIISEPRLTILLGLQRSLVTPLSVQWTASTRLWVRAKNLYQLYSSTSHHRTTTNL